LQPATIAGLLEREQERRRAVAAGHTDLHDQPRPGHRHGRPEQAHEVVAGPPNGQVAVERPREPSRRERPLALARLAAGQLGKRVRRRANPFAVVEEDEPPLIALP
jgi:hypothetical protein